MSVPSDDAARDPDDRLDRRRVLRLGSGGALALVIGGGAGWLDRRRDPASSAAPVDLLPSPPTTAPGPSTTTTTAAPLVLDDIGEVDPAIVAIGRRVIETTGESDLAALTARLPATTDDDDPVVRAAAVVAEEFRSGDTLTVDGWLFASSEAWAAAILALLCEDAC